VQGIYQGIFALKSRDSSNSAQNPRILLEQQGMEQGIQEFACFSLLMLELQAIYNKSTGAYQGINREFCA